MIPTPMQLTRRYGLGAVNWRTGETLVIMRHYKRRREVTGLLQVLLDHHRDKTVYVAWDNVPFPSSMSAASNSIMMHISGNLGI
jgi:hypothetical protein